MATQEKVLLVHSRRPKSAACLSSTRPESGKYLRVYSATSQRSERHLPSRQVTANSSVAAPQDGENASEAPQKTTVQIKCDGKFVCLGFRMGSENRLSMRNIKIYTVSKHHKAKQITAVLEGRRLNGSQSSQRYPKCLFLIKFQSKIWRML